MVSCGAAAAWIILAKHGLGIAMKSVPIFLQSLPFSIAAAALFIFAVAKLREGGASDRSDAILSWWIALLFIPAGYLAEEALNTNWDAGPSSAHVCEIKGKTAWKSRSDYRYQLVLTAWNPDVSSIFLDVPREVYLKAHTGTISAKVVTKPGYFGHEWIVDWSLL